MNELSLAWDDRVARLLARLPARVGATVNWLRHPSRRLVRLGSALLLILGGIFSILPVLGIWMLPLGLALLAEDVPGLKDPLERGALWLEHRWRGWFGRRPPASAALDPAAPPEVERRELGVRRP